MRRWSIFKCICKHAKVDSGGFSGLKDVTNPNAPKNDHQESFFLAETLKYLVRCLPAVPLQQIALYRRGTKC